MIGKRLCLLVAGTAILVAHGTVSPSAAEPVSTSPYDANPALRALMDAVTFHHSFDHESLVPDMALGDWKFQRHGEPRLAPGLLGKALVAGTGALFFADTRNWTIATRGALALWVSPVQWNHREAGNTYFVVSQRSAFYLERQGALPKPDRSPGRQEVVLAGMQGSLRGSRGADCRLWPDGQWHLLAVNWSWPQLALSVDGGAFNAIEFREKPDASLSGGFMLGSRGGDHTLLDEFLCFNRPLSEDEVRALYEALVPRGNSIFQAPNSK